MNKSYIKGFLEDIVLHLIAQRGECYGYELTKLVEERTQGLIKIQEGALYPVLHKLEDKGLLISELRQEENRPRKYYKLSKANQEKAITQDALAYIKALQAIFN